MIEKYVSIEVGFVSSLWLDLLTLVSFFKKLYPKTDSKIKWDHKISHF